MWLLLILKIGRFVNRPSVQLGVSLVLVAVSVSEIWQSFDSEVKGPSGLRLHHGMLVFGVANSLKSLPGIVEGMEHMNRAAKAARIAKAVEKER